MHDDLIQWLYGLQEIGIKLGLDNIRALLELFDHPERAYPSMLVGGTNGKGSVAAMVESMLGAAGLRAGMFTSPHLLRPHERVRIGGEDIDDAELQLQLAEIRARIEAALGSDVLPVHPSFFEVITTTALEQFRKSGVAAAVLEVGLGGRLDATNAVDAAVSVIVGVDLDHTKTLGSTLEKIATEKAGIVKPGKPVVCGVVQQRAIDVIREVCKRRGAELVDARAEVVLVHDDGERFGLKSRRAAYPDLALPLEGRHQIDNARVALAAFERFADRLGLAADPEAVRAGLAAVRWPGRLQWLDGAPRVLLDAAHNEAGVQVLADYLRRQKLPAPVMLFGATKGKRLAELLTPLSELADALIVTRPPVKKGLDPAEVGAVARPLFRSVELIPDPEVALDRARELAGPEGYVLVTGSLYLVGEALGLLTGAAAPGPVSM